MSSEVEETGTPPSEAKGAYVYLSIPPAGTLGHRADVWDVNKWNQEVDCKVVSMDDECFVRLLEQKTGVLFAEAPIRKDVPASTVVDPVVDSSRYYVLRVEDTKTRRHAFIGFGFRERGEASDFNAALHEHAQYLRRKREAAEMRAAYESDAEGAAPSTAVHRDLSLKEGETLTLKLAGTSPASSGRPLTMRGAKLGGSMDLFGAGVRGSTSAPDQTPAAVPVLAPPPSAGHIDQARAAGPGAPEAADTATDQPVPAAAVAAAHAPQQFEHAPGQSLKTDDWGDFQ